ncbi:cupin domain-containing protein [Burkholderia ubonensis]|uniref:Cupin n=1 Tax=Burkholderia ubonensis TaxID=101571 RepID=A0AB74D189_9BURK|nr:cupin domain-containing protein [Burkholderia ubonensis]PAJ81271.1 cupin [Burkholderia ubonensis]PAJ86700.1 cupin [Burkholderia ubonensis]PAJ95154.1 cupin [Burkholderia ubonensis]PAJ99951.1 cupin [Burkholderia ubonensis]PAK06917.1 cupin [Burkholderia ubonensis]
MDRKTAALSIALVVGCLGASPAWAQSGGHRTVTPSDLKWTDAAALPPGAKIAVIEGPMDQAVSITARVKLPANYEIPAHWHPAVERATVLSGTFNIGTGDKLDRRKTTALPAGSVSIMQPKMNHFAWTSEETVLQLNTAGPWDINYVNPADDPRKK